MSENSPFMKEYIQTAIERGNALTKGDYRTANKSYKKLTKIYKKFEKDLPFAEVMLQDLIRCDNYLVQICAAAHSLGLNILVDEAQKILLEISRRRDIGIIRLEAETTLEEWKKKGRLKF